jgi:glycosyltransferase involved in cell wall biosynthesis
MGFDPRNTRLLGFGKDIAVKISLYRNAAYFCAPAMKPLRVLILTNRIPHPLHDGGAMAMDALIRGYHQAGMLVHVLAMNTTRHYLEEQILPTLYPEIHGFEAVPVNNALRPLKLLQNLLFSRDPEHAGRFRNHAYTTRLQELLRAFKPDVVQMESLFLSTYLYLIKDAATVLRVHNIEYQIWERQAAAEYGPKKHYLHLLARRMKRYEAQVWGMYDLLLPITEEDAVTIRKVHPDQTMVVAPYGIDELPEATTIAPVFTKVYHMAAMDWLPNIAAVDWLLEKIWPDMKKAVPAAELHFGGRKMPLRFFDSLPEGAYCHGEVPDARAFQEGKDILVVPLRAGGGIRVKILEAMASGKLVISTAIGMQGIAASSGIHYLKADTAEEFRAAFQWANDHPDAAGTMIREARNLIAQQYSSAAIIRNILARFTTALPIRRS